MFDIRLTNAAGQDVGWIDGILTDRQWYAHISSAGTPVGSIWPGSAKVRRPA